MDRDVDFAQFPLQRFMAVFVSCLEEREVRLAEVIPVLREQVRLHDVEEDQPGLALDAE